MTTFTETPVLASKIITAANLAQYKDRHKGPPHVSDLVFCLRKTWARRNGVKGVAMSEDEQTMLLAGQAHHILIQAADKGWRTEVELHDPSIPVQGTVDVIMEDGIPIEIKTTRSSARKTPSDSPHYLEQLGSYVLLAKQNKGYLALLHLLGDYTGAKVSKFRMWSILFTPTELANWREELRRRARILVGPSLPPVEEHHSWECDYCPLAQKKGGFCPGGPGRTTNFFPVALSITLADLEEEDE